MSASPLGDDQGDVVLQIQSTGKGLLENARITMLRDPIQVFFAILIEPCRTELEANLGMRLRFLGSVGHVADQGGWADGAGEIIDDRCRPAIDRFILRGVFEGGLSVG